MKASLQVGVEVLVRDVRISLKSITVELLEHVHGAGSAWVVLPVVRTECNIDIVPISSAKDPGI